MRARVRVAAPGVAAPGAGVLLAAPAPIRRLGRKLATPALWPGEGLGSEGRTW